MIMLTVLKVGGNVIDDPLKLEALLRAFVALEGPKLLVHGGGKLASDMARSLGIEPRMVDGRRITDEAMLRIVTMTYAGWIGKRIAAQLNVLGCKALSLCGADGALIPSTRRAAEPIDFGLVGDPVEADVDVALIEALLASGCVPVIAPITADREGQLLNTNADTIAAVLAGALATRVTVRLYLAFEKDGVLDGNGDVIPELSPAETAQAIAGGVVKDGMRPKLTAGFRALAAGVHEVVVGSSDHVTAVLAGTAKATHLKPDLP